MREVHNISHAMSEDKEGMLCWRIYIFTEKNCKSLNIIACLDSDVHETTNPVIEATPK